jgi:hypothetical protein
MATQEQQEKKDNLFLSILAMDAYNRGYDAGIKSPSAGEDEGLSGNLLGNAILRQDALPSGFKAASFYAQSYTWNGKTVISYRGTDDPGKDAPAFFMGAG